MLATDSFQKKPIAGALVTHENEAETIFFLQTLKKWLSKPVNFITIDFSPQLESGVNEVFPQILTQKCIFHSIHLLTKAFLKELNRLKREKFSHRIEEWNIIQRSSRILEKYNQNTHVLGLKHHDIQRAWKIYRTLRNIFSTNDPRKVEHELQMFLSTPRFIEWCGSGVFMEKYHNIFTKRALTFTKKGVKYITIETYRAWRAAILHLRREEETLKLHFNDMKYLMLMNPLNMKLTHQKSLRTYIKEFPWLRSYRKLLVKFYYQFRLPPEKRNSLRFLSHFDTVQTHSRLKSAVKTLIENEDKIFRYQQLPCDLASKKSIKVVDESSNRIIQKLYFTQYGMRTIKNLRMRISKRLNCPIIVSPHMLEKYNTDSNLN